MRRPSPLPPTGQATPGAAKAPAAGPIDTEADTVRAEAAAGTGPAEAGDAEPSVAPVIPLTSTITMQRPVGFEAGLDEPPRDLPAEAGDQSRVGLREVWRAARARRRMLRAEVRRFTVRQRRRRAAWLGAAASVVVLVLATLAAAYSPLFGVEKIQVVGASQLDATTVEAALDGQLGTPLPLVDESAVKAALITFPLVESYTLEARPPHELVVRIVERTPVGLIKTAAGYTLVDAAGVVLSTTPTAVAGAPLLTVKGGTGTSAFEAIGRVMRALPTAIRAQVTAVSASTPDDVTLTLGGTRTKVVWGSAEDSALKAVVLTSLMSARPPAGVKVYDVSSPHAAVVS